MAVMDTKSSSQDSDTDIPNTYSPERNASGHRDQLKRQYGLISIIGLALAIDNAWVALAGSITVSIGMLSLYPSKSPQL